MIIDTKKVPLGTTIAKIRILEVLGIGPMLTADIADHLDSDFDTIRDTIFRLHRRGLVTEAPRYLFHLSAKGQEFLDMIEAA